MLCPSGIYYDKHKLWRHVISHVVSLYIKCQEGTNSGKLKVYLGHSAKRLAPVYSELSGDRGPRNLWVPSWCSAHPGRTPAP